MKVLKFGGTSVGSAIIINKVIEILSNISKTENVVTVVSAVGGITDKLLAAAQLAVNKNKAYKEAFKTIEAIHLDIVEELIHNNKSQVQSFVKVELSKLKQLLDGLFLINELSPKTTDKLLSFGELLSSYMITEALKSKGLKAVLKNSQELIVTDKNYTNASVNFEVTNKNIISYFNNNSSSITILPGFISKSKDGEITTLGRGGSDYTAAKLQRL